MKKLLFTLALLCLCTSTRAQLRQQIQTFDIGQVQLLESPFSHNRQLDISYLLALNADRLLAPYYKGSGLKPKAENYSNWENTGLDGHIGGHYLSALAYLYAATGNQELGRRMDYFLAELKKCQDAGGNGYLCGVPDGPKMWKEIAHGDIRAYSFSLNDRWVPLYNIHKIYAGLRDAWLIARRPVAKEMLIALSDWMIKEVAQLSDAQIQEMLKSEPGGLNEVFADVSAITGNAKYLELAHRFSDNTMLQPLLDHRDVLTGKHANTQIPKVIGYKRIADIEGKEDWNEAARYFWEVVCRQRSVSIGGNSMREHFNPTNDFSELLESEQGPESCNTYNMLRLTKMLYQTSGLTSYMDYYERALYNHILSIVDPVQGGFVYFTPMRSGHYRVYSQPQTSMWCCVGTGMENPGRYGEMIYAHKGNDRLLVNLFIPSVLQWGKIRLTQTTRFPYEPGTDLELGLKKSRRWRVAIRIPAWTHGLAVSVNGQPVEPIIEDGYAVVDRVWKDKDRIHVDLPMHLAAITTPDGKPQYSFLYGPIVLAAKVGTDNQLGLFADDSRGGHITAGKQLPLDQFPAIIGDSATLLRHLSPVAGSPLTFALNGLSLPQYEGMQLVPFYTLYECRYQIYFPLYSADRWQSEQQRIAREEKARQTVESLTVDKIFCGEQQSESDHFIQFKQSHNGADGGRHWRQAQGGEFSYLLAKMPTANQCLQITVLPEDRQPVTLYIGNTLLGSFEPENGQVSLAIPSDTHIDNNCLRIVGNSPRITEIRLLRSEL